MSACSRRGRRRKASTGWFAMPAASSRNCPARSTLHKNADDMIAALAARSVFDTLVVDDCRLAVARERKARQIASRNAVIDDLADCQHGCNLLLDLPWATPCDTMRLYRQIVARCSAGTTPFCVQNLRPSAKASRRSDEVARILVSFGRIDADDLTDRTMGGHARYAAGRRDRCRADQGVATPRSGATACRSRCKAVAPRQCDQYGGADSLHRPRNRCRRIDKLGTCLSRPALDRRGHCREPACHCPRALRIWLRCRALRRPQLRRGTALPRCLAVGAPGAARHRSGVVSAAPRPARRGYAHRSAALPAARAAV